MLVLPSGWRATVQYRYPIVNPHYFFIFFRVAVPGKWGSVPGGKGGLLAWKSKEPLLLSFAWGSWVAVFFQRKDHLSTLPLARVITIHIIHSLRNSPTTLLFYYFIPSLHSFSWIFLLLLLQSLHLSHLILRRNTANTVKFTPSPVNTNTKSVR